MHAFTNTWTAGLILLQFSININAYVLPFHNLPRLSRKALTARDATAVTPCAAAWQASSTYTSGMLASHNNLNYKANWWIANSDPSTASGESGTGQPWTAQGKCSGDAQASENSNGTSIQSRPTTISSTTVVSSSTTVSTLTSTASAIPSPISAASGKATSTSTSAISSSTAATPAASSTATANSKTSSSSTSGILFSPYKDVTINANWNTNVMSTKITGTLQPVVEAVPKLPALSWAFATGECGSENWGGIAAADFAKANVDNFSAAGIPYILSTGGASGVFTCGSDAGFAAFIDRYDSSMLIGVDFDIESGQTQADIDALVARVKMAQTIDKYKDLRFSFTIATFGGDQSQSLGSMGELVMQSIKTGGLTDYKINLMAMDYGTATASNCVLTSSGTCDMGASATQASENLHAAYSVSYSQIELTVMIGGNDAQSEIFTLDDIATVTAYAKKNGLGGLHTWSLDRDVDCATGAASPSCNSYGKAGVLGFTDGFVKGL